MFKIMAVSLLAVALPLAAVAQSFNGKRGTRVAPVNAAVFEVVGRASATGEDYWCGASDYARRVLGKTWTDKIYIARGRGPSVTTNRKSAVQFTADPAAAGITAQQPSLSLNSLKVGDNMSIQQANLYCQMPPTRF